MFKFEDLVISQATMERLKNKQQLLEWLEQGKSLQDIFGFSDEALIEFYEAAKKIFEQKRFCEAIKAFTFLTNLAPNVPAFWLGLGIAQQNNKEWEQAILSFQAAYELEQINFIPYKLCIECLIEIGNEKDAIITLDLAEKYADEHSEDPRSVILKQESEIARKALENRIRKNEA